ncbi:MAG: NAD-dependent epimerase/dehydratase family protein [Oscillospiraceae bacterium]|nr:NAD-dependent epimerase/dehydratase family protein [Oscillospiraceae bacterium]MDY4191015.1 NAD-dependent epimerase/dehydratase family protein [Oscillospiraceae bacterium]
MKILLIGGTGNISSSLTKLCLQRGDEVWLLNRGSGREWEALGAHSICCDIRDRDQAMEALKGCEFDAAVDFICYTEEQARLDVELLRDRVRHYVFISTCMVYQKPCFQTPVTEDVPRKNPFSDYAQNKIACELYLEERYREEDFPVTIVRPSHTYGEQRLVVGPTLGWQVPHWTLADRILRGKPVIVHGNGRTLWTVTHSDDFARGLYGLLGNWAALGHSFHITGDEALSWDEIMETYGWVLGRRPVVVHLPEDFIIREMPEKVGPIRGDMAENGVFDNSKLKRFVPGFRAEVSLREGLARSVAWFREDPARMAVSEEENRRTDAMIARWEACLKG